MGQAVKYALLGVAIATILALCVVYIGQIPVSDSVASLASSVTSIISYCGDTFRAARGILNALTGVPVLVTASLWLAVMSPFAKIGIKISVAIFRWINQ